MNDMNETHKGEVEKIEQGGDICRIKPLNGAYVQENGIIRNYKGRYLARLDKEIDFEGEHIISESHKAEVEPMEQGGSCMKKFRKKPVVIEACQWFKSGDHPEDNRDTFTDSDTGKPFLGEGKIVRYFRRPDISGEAPCSECAIRFHEHGWIDTLEDGHRVCPGDWIITSIKGEKYPCKPDIFEVTYEPVN